jgi:hypothetical protein
LPGQIDGDAERLGDLFVPQAGEMTQFDDACRERVLGGEAGEGLVEGE